MIARPLVELVQDPAITSRPELRRVTREVTDAFAEWYESGPPTRTPSTVTVGWRLTQPDDSSVVYVDVAEHEEGGFRRGFTRTVPARQLDDPVARGIWATRLWRYLLQALSAENMHRIEQAIQDLERGDADG